MEKHSLVKHTLVIISGILLFACSPAKHLQDNEFLLTQSKIELDSRGIEIQDMKPYMKQSPNKRILGVRFHLWLYNLANPEKERFPHGLLKNIGEGPVIWDPLLTNKTTEQFKNYLETKGYYSNSVEDSVKLIRREAYISYTIKLNEPHRNNSIAYYFEDQNVGPLILSDTANCLIRKGERFDKEVIQAERLRLENLMKNNGYYQFSKEFIFFEASEIPGTRLVDIVIKVKENISGIPDPETKLKRHFQYKINNAFFYPDFNFSRDLGSERDIGGDTVFIGDNIIVYAGKPKLRPDAVLGPNRCVPGSLYSLDNVKKTYNNYAAMGLARIVNIHFRELNTALTDTIPYKHIDAFIEITPRKFQSYNIELVGTNTIGDIGARTNISFNHHNLFSGAENLQIRLSGAVEGGKRYDYYKPMWEIGIESILGFPKLLVPFSAKRFSNKFNPHTLVNVSYNYQSRDYYIRTVANTSFSYKFKGNQYTTHQFYPVEFNYVRLPEGIRDSAKRVLIENSNLRSSFSDHTILSTRYMFEFTTQSIERKSDYFFVRTNLESAGNLIYGVSGLTPEHNDTTFLKVPFFRYFRFDIDLRYHNQLNKGSSIIYRIFSGAGYPLGGQRVLPYEKLYFGGGPNGLRAWESFGVGPGSDTTSKPFISSNKGEIRIEANIEYRFKFIWITEGAVFLDAGNMWTRYEWGEGSAFTWRNFYKEIALGTGVGIRFDFSYFLIRTDFGFKLRDPKLPEGSRWIDLNRQVNYPLNRRFTFHFGIGYPF